MMIILIKGRGSRNRELEGRDLRGRTKLAKEQRETGLLRASPTMQTRATREFLPRCWRLSLKTRAREDD